MHWNRTPERVRIDSQGLIRHATSTGRGVGGGDSVGTDRW